MPIKLLATDLDGTLMVDWHTIPVRTQSVIKAAMEQGVRVTIATGREYALTKKFVDILGLTTPIICYQGALIYDPQTDQPLMSEGLPVPLAHQLVDLSRSHNLALHFYVDGQICAEQSTPQSRTIFKDIGIPLMEITDLKQAVTIPPFKGLIFDTPEGARKIRAQLKDTFGEELHVFRSLDYIVEFTSANVSKGHALATLANYYNIDQSEVMAIGDQDNDIEMIAWAGVGVAMDNASPGAKAAADYIAPPVSQEGAAWAIERFILEQQ